MLFISPFPHHNNLVRVPCLNLSSKKAVFHNDGKIPHLNRGSKLPSHNHAYHLKAIMLEKKLLILWQGMTLKNLICSFYVP